MTGTALDNIHSMLAIRRGLIELITIQAYLLGPVREIYPQVKSRLTISHCLRNTLQLAHLFHTRDFTR